MSLLLSLNAEGGKDVIRKSDRNDATSGLGEVFLLTVEEHLSVQIPDLNSNKDLYHSP